ncbi:MAG TPA: hypothetical protein VHO48_03715 [Anaerolineaceae bacterium]|nr:hypothetical protein [Anaerolineaceae bacterium]
MVSNIQGMGGMGAMNGMGGMGGMRPMGGPGGPAPKELTEEEQTELEKILEEYDSEDLTTEDAEEMFKAFEEAGLRGPGLREGIQKAGFDADEVWSLAHKGQKAPQAAGKAENTNRVDLNALQSLQDILNQYDLANLSSDQEQSLIEQLNQSGLMNLGSMIDLKA